MLSNLTEQTLTAAVQHEPFVTLDWTLTLAAE
jgi:hypothetical protein